MFIALRNLCSVVLLVATSLCLSTVAQAQDKHLLDLEKDSLKFGFIKLTDCAPIVIAKEKGFFESEGLQVDVIAQPNWKTCLLYTSPSPRDKRQSRMPSSA